MRLPAVFFCLTLSQLIQVPRRELKEISPSVWGQLQAAIDHKVHKILSGVARKPSNLSASTCRRVYTLTDPLSTLSEIPTSYDLREAGLQTPVKDQGVCGSCWAFGTMTLVEASIMATRTSFYDTSRDPYFSRVVTEGSVQYLMNTSQSTGNQFCNGGNFIYSAFDYANGNTPTVELQNNWPYTSARLSTNPSTILQHNPKIPPDAYLDPFAKMKTGDSCYSSLIRIYDNTGKPFSRSVINVIKSYIARGIPVVGAMFVDGGGLQGANAFSKYTGGLFHEPCAVYGADHQIAFVGYGYYKGTEVWVVRNSWGEDWGDYGYFYVPIGKDTLCIEHYAYTAIPIESNLAEVLMPSLWKSRKRYLALSDGIYNPPVDKYDYYSGKIIRGLNGLDLSDGTFTVISQRLSAWVIMWIVIGSVLGAVTLALIITLIVVRSRHRRLQITANLKHPQAQLQNIVG